MVTLVAMESVFEHVWCRNEAESETMWQPVTHEWWSTM